MPAKPPTAAELLVRQIRSTNERIAEVVRSILFELGDERLIEAGEQALLKRGIVGKPSRHEKAPRRLTVYLSQARGAALNLRAKQEQVSPNVLIDRAVALYLNISD